MCTSKGKNEKKQIIGNTIWNKHKFKEKLLENKGQNWVQRSEERKKAHSERIKASWQKMKKEGKLKWSVTYSGQFEKQKGQIKYKRGCLCDLVDYIMH